MTDHGPSRGELAHRALGLTDHEYDEIRGLLGRDPSDVELAMYSVMWSEHCSYKSSRIHLRRLPTSGARVLVGPGENAGVVDVGDGLAVALRIESHNHPSYVEPYQGAATGVGGILRDIFTMGARPIALMDPLFVGPLDDPHSRYILDGIVRGVGGYGNAVGVPTVGGQITFDPCYRHNPLVNVFCLGVLPVERLVLGRASGVGNCAVLLGARTGRDGIGGVSVLASAGFDGATADKRPSVQVGDPYEEKRLIEACLELLDLGLVVGIQDLGGAGLACATSETAARAGLGMDVQVDAVSRREPQMNPVEVMTSESQERMLAIVTPSALERVLEVCRRWEVEASVIGTVTEPDQAGVGHLRVVDDDGSVVADVPARSLADEAPLYERPIAEPASYREGRSDRRAEELTSPDYGEDLRALLYDPAWIYTQYDHQLFANTVLGPGEADASLLRLGVPGMKRTKKAIAISTDANPAWCAIDPEAGTAATVAESVLNVAATGATPVAVVNCCNFGNPEHAEVMWQLSRSIDGMARACEAFSVPVVGGNVSLYNESDGRDIDPTPTIAVLGLVERLAQRPPQIAWQPGDQVVVCGWRSEVLGGSRWARERHGCRTGALPPLDLENHRRLVEAVASLVAREAGDVPPGVVSGLHVVKDGGLAVALAELAVRSGVGAVLEGISSHRELFSEAVSRVLVATARPDEVISELRSAGVPAEVIGVVGGDCLHIEGLLSEPVRALAEARAARIRDALGEVALR